MRKIDTIVVHCSATPEGRPVSVATIRDWHIKRNFRDIGYHFVIGLNGEIWTGRPIFERGAHVRGHNTGSIGICYVGGVTNDGRLAPKDTRTPEQKTALVKLMRGLLADYPSITRICGHRDFPGVRKACPCFDAEGEYEKLLIAPDTGPRLIPVENQDPAEEPDVSCQPSFEPDRIDDRDLTIPAELEKPITKSPTFYERILQLVVGSGLAGLAPFFQDWRVVAGFGATVVVLAILGLVFQQRLVKSIKSIKEAAG